MAVSVSKDTSFSSGAISFSALRSKFKRVSSGAVSLSELKRQNSVSLTSPTVPDATENGKIPTTNSNIQLSDYRGSITYYRLYQSGTNINLNISLEPWNSNLGKNVPKQFIINGTVGATSTSNYAATFVATAYNLSISVGSGYILGAGGAGGTTSSPNGKNGGPALYVRSTGARINLYGTSRILSGGGGGGCGATGGTGGKGGRAESGQTGGAGGGGGAGGAGGRGQGYGQSRTNGSGGAGGSGGATGSGGGGNGGPGGKGGTGGNGGSWGKNGSRGNIGSSGGRGTNAVSGLYFRVYNDATIPFSIRREAFRQSTIRVPGIADFTISGTGNIDDTDNKSYNLNAGYYGIITAFENNPPFTPPSASDWVKIKVSSSSISLDDNQARRPDGDYQDIVVTSTNTGLGVFGTFSPPDFGVPGRPSNYGSGGSAGTRISGSNYIIRS